jgi:hypothetical protein
MDAIASSDPFQVLGLTAEASEADVRARYLELVKQFSPDREPEKFREIRAAYEAARDPLSVARRLVAPPDETVPAWSDAIKSQQNNPPRLSPALVLSLGNRTGDSQDAGPRST